MRMHHNFLAMACAGVFFLQGCADSTNYYANSAAALGVSMMRKNTAEENEKYLDKFFDGPRTTDPGAMVAILCGVIGDAAYYLNPDEINSVVQDKNQLRLIMNSIASAKSDAEAQAVINGWVSVFTKNKEFVDQRLALLNKRIGSDNAGLIKNYDEYFLIWDDAKYNQFMTDDQWAEIYIYKSMDQENHPTRSADFDYVTASQGIFVQPVPVRNGS